MDEIIRKPPKPKRIDQIKELRKKGKTYKQIAEELEITEQHARNVIYRDRKRKEKEKTEEEPKRKPGRPKGSKNARTLAEESFHLDWAKVPSNPLMREDNAELNRAAGVFVTECWKIGQATSMDDIDSLYNALKQYVQLCTYYGMPMLVKTCHLALGLNSRVINSWRNGKTRKDDPRYQEFVNLMDAIIAAGIEAAGAAGSLDKVLTIWFEKAHFGLYEQQGITIENADPLGEKKATSEIVKQYAELLPDDSESKGV